MSILVHVSYFAGHEVNDKRYEFSNHLGNVLEVVTDHKLPTDSNSDGNVDYYLADVVSYSDYYPFGMLMPNRHGSSADYRYGFNGMEKDDEVKSSEGTSYDFGARMYDPRVGRWLSIDPLAVKYPNLSPYCFVANSPLLFVDPNGKEIIIHYKDENGESKQYTYTPGIKPTVQNTFVQAVHESVNATMGNGTATNDYLSVAASKKPVHIVEIQDDNNGTGYTYDSNENPTKIIASTIYWNPNIAVESTDGGGNSPSTVLYHEIVHAKRGIEIETKEQLIQFRITDKEDNGTPYHNNEEQRTVYKEVEMVRDKNDATKNPYVVLPKEAERKNHSANGTYKVNSPTSITPSDPTKKIKNTETKSSGYYERNVPADNTRVNNIYLPKIEIKSPKFN